MKKYRHLQDRIRNVAGHKDLAKCLRACNTVIHLSSNVESTLKAHSHLLSDMLLLTPRVSKKALSRACAEHDKTVSWDLSQAFAEELLRALMHCRKKKSNASTGQCYSSAEQLVIAAIDNSAGKTLLRKAAMLTSPRSTGSGSRSSAGAFFSASLSRASASGLLENLYGIETSPKSDVESLVDLISSQEDAAPRKLSQLLPANTKAVPKEFVEYMKGFALVRAHAGGVTETAQMSQGPNGFCMAYFESTGESVQTELPNLSLSIYEVSKRPAMAMKRPAAARKKPARCEKTRGTAG